MNCPEFTQERNMITLEPQDLLRIFERNALFDLRPSMRRSRPSRYIRGSGLFSPYDVTPLLISESKDTSAQSHWKNLKSTARDAVARVRRGVKNKEKTPKYDTLLEEAESYETDESDDATGYDYSKDTNPLTDQKSTALTCSICQQVFSTKGHLGRHTQSIHSLTKFKCDACKRTFSRVDSLNVHRRKCGKQ
jgi:hypothetical protein